MVLRRTLSDLSQVIVIARTSSGFGELTAKVYAHAGHVVYAGMGDLAHGNPAVQNLEVYARTENVDLHPVALNVISEDPLKAGMGKLIEEAVRIDVLIHNAAHMSFGPTETSHQNN